MHRTARAVRFYLHSTDPKVESEYLFNVAALAQHYPLLTSFGPGGSVGGRLLKVVARKRKGPGAHLLGLRCRKVPRAPVARGMRLPAGGLSWQHSVPQHTKGKGRQVRCLAWADALVRSLAGVSRCFKFLIREILPNQRAANASTGQRGREPRGGLEIDS